MVVGIIFHDEWLPFQVAQGDFLGPDEGVTLGDHSAEIVLHELDPVIGEVRLAAVKEQVHGAVPEPFIQVILSALPDGEGDTGVAGGKVPEDVGHPEPGDAGKDAHGDVTHSQTTDISHFLLQHLAFVVELPKKGKDTGTVGGGTDT